MDPITAVLMAASLAGAIKGGDRKFIDENWLKEHFGAHAISEEAKALFAHVINSPQGQQIIGQAAESGQQFGNQVQAQAAQAGLTPGGGASTGTGVFATSAGDSASNAAVSQARGNVYASVLPVAQQIVQDRMATVVGDQQRGGTPTKAANVWSTIGNAAGTALAAGGAPKEAAGGAGTALVDSGSGASYQSTVAPSPSISNFRSMAGATQPSNKWSWLSKGRRMLGGAGRMIGMGR